MSLSESPLSTGHRITTATTAKGHSTSPLKSPETSIGWKPVVWASCSEHMGSEREAAGDLASHPGWPVTDQFTCWEPTYGTRFPNSSVSLLWTGETLRKILVLTTPVVSQMCRKGSTAYAKIAWSKVRAKPPDTKSKLKIEDGHKTDKRLTNKTSPQHLSRLGWRTG